MTAGEHLVEDDAQREDVGAPIDDAPQRLLGDMKGALPLI